MIIRLSLCQDILQDIAQSENTDQSVATINNDQAVDTRLSNGIKHTVESIVYGAGEDSGKILWHISNADKIDGVWKALTSARLVRASPTF